VRLLASAGLDVNVDNEELDAFSDGGQPLHNAAIAGAYEAAQALLEYGADVNSQSNPRQETPLLLACRFNHINVVKLLLEKGADISLCDVDGNTALDDASMRPETDMEIIQLLQGHE
jgi:ankyrin repeat protein